MLLRTIVVVLALATVLGAAPITFILTGTGSGAVASTAFSNVALTFTLTTDTTLITPFTNGFRTPQVTGVGLSIAGFGNGTFAHTEHFFDNTTNSGAGLTDIVAGDLLDGTNALFATYNLQAAIGPVSMDNPNTAGQFVNIPTSIGNVTLTSATNVTLTALTVPEPATIGLTALGLLGLLRIGRRTRCRSNPIDSDQHERRAVMRVMGAFVEQAQVVERHDPCKEKTC